MPDDSTMPALPPADPEVYAYMKGQGMPDRDAEGMAALGWFSDVPSSLSEGSTLDEIHEYAAMSEAGSDFIFNLPNVVAYADGLLSNRWLVRATLMHEDGAPTAALDGRGPERKSPADRGRALCSGGADTRHLWGSRG